ncbi:MAG: hypothetical protein WBI17_09695 [Clostridiaceae bacterium]
MSGKLTIENVYEIMQDKEDIEEILNSKVFSRQSNPNWILEKAAFVLLMIDLRDLVWKSEHIAGKRIDFTDDIVPFRKVVDVTDLIAYVRDAAVHNTSGNSRVEQGKISFIVGIGKENIVQIGELSLSCDYDDDICFVFGPARIYLKRHIIRAFIEAIDILNPLIKEMQQKKPGFHPAHVVL